MIGTSKRLRLWAAAAAVTAVAGGVALTGTALASASAPAPAAAPVVVVTCQNTAVVRPGHFVLACADGNDYLTGMHWVSWRNVAYGAGTEHVNDCVPNCAAGHVFRYPVLLTLWRAQARPGHAGQQYFSRLTAIRTGQLHKAPGSTLPRTQTWQLGASGG